MSGDLAPLLHALAPELHSGVFAFVSLPPGADVRALPAIATMREAEGWSAVLLEAEAEALALPVLFRAAWITLGVASDLHAVGLTAAVSGALAAAGIACNVVAGARHDHLFVPIARVAEAMQVLERLRSGRVD